MILHAGLVALRAGGGWKGALILGSSGAGKSDLMLRAMEQGLRLVADDRTVVWASGGRLYGRAPEPLAGLIEVRGLGVLEDQAHLPLAEVVVVAHCEAKGAALERLPEPAAECFEGVSVPALRLGALEASAPAKLGRALWRLGQGRRGA